MTITEILIILFLFVVAVLVANSYGYDKGYLDGVLDGMKEKDADFRD